MKRRMIELLVASFKLFDHSCLVCFYFFRVLLLFPLKTYRVIEKKEKEKRSTHTNSKHNNLLNYFLVEMNKEIISEKKRVCCC